MKNTTIAFWGLILTTLIFVFGNDQYGKWISSKEIMPQKRANNIETVSELVDGQPVTDSKMISYWELPDYKVENKEDQLVIEPILDRTCFIGAFLQEDSTLLVLGGANIEDLKIGACTMDGAKIRMMKNRKKDWITLPIKELPYLEIAYKDNYYSIETSAWMNIPGKQMIYFNKIKEPKLKLVNYKSIGVWKFSYNKNR